MHRGMLFLAALVTVAGSSTAQAAGPSWTTHPFGVRVGPLSTVAGNSPHGGVPYSALGFTVGPEPELRPPVVSGGPFEPPAIGTTRRYRAVAVRSASSRGHTVSLVLSTDDPAGRTVSLRIAPNRHGVVALDARVRGPRLGEVSAVAMAFASGSREAFHGFGGRRESTNLRGRSFASWVLDYRYPDASTGYYAPETSFLSSRGYGAYLADDRIARWRLASDTPGAWRVAVGGATLRLIVAPGRPARAMRALTSITGRHRVPPAWSLGPTLSRTYGVIADNPQRYRREVEEDVARLERGNLPVSAYAFEGWGGLPRALVGSLVHRLRAKGIRTILYLRSFAADDVAGTEPRGTFEHAVSHGFVATTESGAPFLIPSPFPGAPAAVIDFTNPGARRWWRARVARLLDTGAVGFMNDFGEQVLPAMHFRDGETGETMHNRYPVLQARVTREAVDAWERHHRHRHVFFFQRAGFSGRPGSPAYENAEFPGDETVDWQSATGLPSIVPDMLNRAVGGAPGFTTDIGGYAQFTTKDPILPATSKELFIRWSEAAALTPFFRVHNSGLDGVRMPWSFDRATLRAWIGMARLHRRAQPLLLRLWRAFTGTGMPMTQPLWLADPGGGRGPRGDDEWLLGGDLLVAPVLREGARSRPVRLPPGCWRLHGGGAALRGSRTVTVRASLTQLPWYARCGTAPLR